MDLIFIPHLTLIARLNSKLGSIYTLHFENRLNSSLGLEVHTLRLENSSFCLHRCPGCSSAEMVINENTY